MASALLRQMYSLINLERAWHVIRQNGRFSKSEEVRSELLKFGEEASANLRSIQHRLARGKFEFPRAKGVPIPKLDHTGRPTGKFRPIVLAPVEARIVQRALLNVLLEVPALQPFIKTKYSFGGLRAEQGDASDSGDSLSAVPGAIHAALEQVGKGATFYATADIRSFFTRIPKSMVIEIIGQAVSDAEFMDFFERAITVELSNMAALREKAAEFPLEDIGVAQGNSLSPLLGNIVLAEFDSAMNEGDCACIRYIDDFIIFSPSEKAGNARLKKSARLLQNLEMELSPEKSARGAAPVESGFVFLGVEVCPGWIRPTRSSQRSLLEKVDSILEDGRNALIGLRSGNGLDRQFSLLSTLRRVDTTVSGWGKHYWFCNDDNMFRRIDRKVWERVRKYLGCYSDIRERLTDDGRPLALGLTQLRFIERQSFSYPRVAN